MCARRGFAQRRDSCTLGAVNGVNSMGAMNKELFSRDQKRDDSVGQLKCSFMRQDLSCEVEALSAIAVRATGIAKSSTPKEMQSKQLLKRTHHQVK
jgi:hypothetical protein